MKKHLAAALLLCAASPAAAADLNYSAIKVNGATIPASRVQTDLVGRRHASQALHGSAPTGGPSAGKQAEQVVNRIIVRELLVQEARRRGLVATEAEIAAAWEAERSRWGGEEKFQKSLEFRGVTVGYLRERSVEDILLHKLAGEINAAITVTEQDERDHHAKNPGLFPVPGEPLLRCLYIDNAKHGGRQGAVKRYREFRMRLDKGEPYAKLIEEFSDHPTAGSGGVIAENSELPFIDRARVLVPGQFADPSENESGLYGYYRDHDPQTLPFEQARAKVRASLLEQLRKARFEELVRDLRAAAKIEFVP